MPIDLSSELVDLGVMGIGSGAKGAIAGWVKQFAPDLSIDIAGLLAGFLLYQFGERIDPLVKKFGAGVLIGSIGQLTAGLTGGLLGGQAQTQTQTQTQTNVSSENQLKSLASMEANRA